MILLWESQTKNLVETICNIDKILLADDTYDNNMRQQSLSGAVVNFLEELYSCASRCKEYYDVILNILVVRAGIDLSLLSIAPMKGRERALEKTKDDYSKRKPGPSVSWLFDVVRASVICDDEEQMVTFVEVLLKEQECEGIRFEVVRLKNRFK